MKNLWKRCLAAATALLMTAGTLGFAGLAGAEPVSAVEDTVTVYISSQEDGTFLHPYGAYEVSADLAESYGYEDNVKDGVSALDALVKAHELIFGEDNVNEYLTVDNGSVKKFFTGAADGGFGFAVDGEQPHSDETFESSGMPLSYSGYSVDNARIGNGSHVEFFGYVDSMALDYYPYVSYKGDNINKIKAPSGAEVSLDMQGIWIGWYGLAVDKEMFYEPVEDAQLAWVNEKGEISDIDGAVTDENGEVTITIPSSAVSGERLMLTAYVSEEKISDYATPLIMPVLTVQVTDGGEVTGTFERGEAVTDEPQGGESEKPADAQIEEATTAALRHALDLAAEPAFGDEWQVLALARTGAEVPDGYYDIYYDNIAGALEKYDGKLMEGGDLPTDYAKVIITLTAIGRDVTDIEGYDITDILQETYEKKGGTATQVAFALISLDAAEVNKNVDKDDFKQTLLDNLVKMKNDDGGFSTAGSTYKRTISSDVDTTAMVVQALAPYYGDESIKTVVDDALRFLENAQNDDGGYSLAESSAQTVIALTALSIDPGEVTDGKTYSPLDSLMSFYIGDGKFQYGSIAGENHISTEQGTLALAAYNRYLNGETSLYDMSDVEIRQDNVDAGDIGNGGSVGDGDQETGDQDAAGGSDGESIDSADPADGKDAADEAARGRGPQTGDVFPMEIMLLAMTLAATGGVCVVLVRKRHFR